MRGKKTLITFIISILLISVSGIIGFQMARKEPRIVEKPTETAEAIKAGVDDSRIAADAKLSVYTEYKMCNHTTFEEFLVTQKMQGLTFTEFIARYPNLRVIAFHSNEIVIKNVYSCYCPQHYILKKNGNKLAVFRTSPGLGELSLYKETNVNYNRVDENEKKELMIGKVFNSLEDIDDYIEKIINND